MMLLDRTGKKPSFVTNDSANHAKSTSSWTVFLDPSTGSMRNPGIPGKYLGCVLYFIEQDD